VSTAARTVADQIAALQKAVEDLQRAPRLANASIEGFPLTVNDEDGQQRQTIGLQPDGTYTTVDVNGPPPPVPSLPTIEARPGALVVTWDGTFAGGVAPPADWDHVEVHRSTTSGYTPTDETQVATFNTLKGGSLTLALDPVAHYIVFQAVSTSRTESAPTAEVAGTPLPAATADGVKTYYEDTPPLGLGADDDGSLWFDTNDGNHPYRWDGPTLQWLTVRDGSIAAASAAAATAQTQANNALTAAQAAQATADGAIRTYYQSNPPWANGSSQPAEVVGDLWFDTDDGQAYRWNGTTWVIIEDNSIAAALAAAQNAQTTADGKITSYYQTTTPTIGELGDLWYDTDDQNKPYYCSSVTPLTWTSLRDGTIAQAQQTANDALDAATTDGLAPTSSPDPMWLAGIGMFIIRWEPIVNADPVTYEVHISSTLGFTPTAGDPATLVGTTDGSQFTVRALPGPDPAPGEVDPRALDYDTTYYVRIIATDADGAAPYSLQTPASALRVTGIDLAVDSVTAANIVAGTLTGELFSATVIMAGTFKTAETGQRIEFGIAGIRGYKSDGSLMINFPTADGEEALFDGEMIARGLTVLKGASFSGDSELNADSTWTLQSGITSPSATPQVGVTYDAIQISTAGLTAAEKTGALGTFDLVPTEVSCIEWKQSSPDYWVVHQIRSNGTRAWLFRVSTGAPDILAGGQHFTDYADWEYHSVWQIPASGAHPGVYRMGRWIPDGALNTYYLSSPAGLNRYSRQNGVAPPAIGSDGNFIFTAEVINTSLRVRYWVPDGAGGNLTSPTQTFESGQGYTASHALCTILYSSVGFDTGSSGGTGKFAVAERGWNTNQRLLNEPAASGGTLYPDGSGGSWTSSTKEASSFESPTSNRRAMAWDATNSCFWTFGADGYMYKHTSERWDPSVTSSKFWAAVTYYDDVGTPHETLPGPPKSYTANRRAKNYFNVPPLSSTPTAEEPNKARLYMARGATQPPNSSFHLQYTGNTNTTWQTMATATAVPPTVNNFPLATAAKIRNPDDSLVISGDGSIKAASIKVDIDDVAIDGPYYYAWINSQAGVATNVLTTLTGYTGDGSPFNRGITVASGVFTLPKAGRYNFRAQLYWTATTPNTAVGQRLLQCVMVSPSLTITSHTVVPNTTIDVVNMIDKDYRVAAGAQVFFRFRHTQGATPSTLAPQTASLDLSWVQIKYVGA
jgi:hypothetical protein